MDALKSARYHIDSLGFRSNLFLRVSHRVPDPRTNTIEWSLPRPARTNPLGSIPSTSARAQAAADAQIALGQASEVEVASANNELDSPSKAAGLNRLKPANSQDPEKLTAVVSDKQTRNETRRDAVRAELYAGKRAKVKVEEEEREVWSRKENSLS